MPIALLSVFAPDSRSALMRQRCCSRQQPKGAASQSCSAPWMPLRSVRGEGDVYAELRRTLQRRLRRAPQRDCAQQTQTVGLKRWHVASATASAR